MDEETLRLARSYAGYDFDKRGTVTVEAFSESPPEEWTLDEFQKMIGEAVDAIPEECRASATVDFQGGYDESCYLAIKYKRSETDAEVAGRVSRAIAYANGVRAKERTEFERLKAKYGA